MLQLTPFSSKIARIDCAPELDIFEFKSNECDIETNALTTKPIFSSEEASYASAEPSLLSAEALQMVWE